jgi:hypothetical protein
MGRAGLTPVTPDPAHNFLVCTSRICDKRSVLRSGTHRSQIWPPMTRTTDRSGGESSGLRLIGLRISGAGLRIWIRLDQSLDLSHIDVFGERATFLLPGGRSSLIHAAGDYSIQLTPCQSLSPLPEDGEFRCVRSSAAC